MDRTSNLSPPSHDAERAADCQSHSKHISTLTQELLPVGCIRYSLRMGFKTLIFFCPVLGGLPGEAGSAPLRRADRCGVSCRRRSGSSVSPVGSPLESGVSPAHIGPSNACPRAAPETTPLWRLFLITLSLSLSLSLCQKWEFPCLLLRVAKEKIGTLLLASEMPVPIPRYCTCWHRMQCVLLI